MANFYKTNYIEIKKMMAEKEINTIKELSEKSGINRNTLGKILSGEIQPSAEAMEGIAIALEMKPEIAGRIFFNIDLRSA